MRVVVVPSLSIHHLFSRRNFYISFDLGACRTRQDCNNCSVNMGVGGAAPLWQIVYKIIDKLNVNWLVVWAAGGGALNDCVLLRSEDFFTPIVLFSFFDFVFVVYVAL